MVDEVNVQLLPCSGSEKDSVGIFGKGNIEEYDLIGFKKTEGGSILLNYKKIPYEIKKTISVVCLNEKTALNKNVSLDWKLNLLKTKIINKIKGVNYLIIIRKQII